VEEVPSGEAEIKKLLANNLGNEFVGRIQTTIPFRYLTAEDVEQIISLTITSYKQRFAQTKPGLKINITQEAKKFIGEKGYQKDLGARSVMAYMDRNVLEQVAQRILTKRQENQDYEPMIVRVSLREGQEVAVGMEYNSSE
jgi:ATP-dependent Clp protease ATP-binding subunit ClpA